MIHTPDQIRAITDPRQRVEAVNAAIKAHQHAISELAQVTYETVLELRKAGASHADVAKVLGVTRSRAAALARSKNDDAQ